MSAARNVAGAAVLTGAIALTGLFANPPPPARPTCARKVPDAGCLRWRPLSPGDEPTATDPGDWNRFPAEQAQGDCRAVECVIALGERANP